MANKVEIMSPVDAAWLSMEEPTNLMMVNAVITFDEVLEQERVLAVLENRWLRYGRFKQRVAKSPLPLVRPYWETDPHFDVNRHVHRLALPEPGNKSALQDMVSDLMSQPVDFARPPWQFYIIENYGDGCAVMARIHHCVADGMALVSVLLAMTDFRPDAPLTATEPVEAPGGRGWLGGMVRDLAGTLSFARGTAGRAVREVNGAVRDGAKVRKLGETGAAVALSGGRLLLRPDDPRTPFKGALGVQKRAAWSVPLALSEVKAVKNALGGTVNDVLVTALAGGMRRYLIGRGHDVTDLEIRAAIPVNLRNESDNGQLGNKFGLVFLDLPINVPDPLLRLTEVRRRMDELKRSAEAPVTLGLLGAMGIGTDAFREFVVKTLEPKATVVMTNVPGPPIPLYLAGCKIKEMMFWVPQAGRLGMGASILSYAGEVFLGIATDAGLVPDPEAVIAGFYADFAYLKLLAEAVRAGAGEL